MGGLFSGEGLIIGGGGAYYRDDICVKNQGGGGLFSGGGAYFRGGLIIGILRYVSFVIWVRALKYFLPQAFNHRLAFSGFAFCFEISQLVIPNDV